MWIASRRTVLLLPIVVLAFFAPLLLRGEVIYPHANDLELGLALQVDDGHVTNRKFSDMSSFFIPELHHHLHGRRSGWIVTWNPHIEVGRPAAQGSSLSRTFVLTHILSYLTADAFVLYSVLTLVAVILTCTFAYLWLASLGLHPAACVSGALGLSLGVLVAYWLTFVLFIWSICWTLALLWLVNRFVERPDWARGLAVAFAVHALLITGYPQSVVYQGYVVSAYTLVCLFRSHGSARAKFARGTKLFVAVLVGFASAAPVYLDILLAASRSVRLAGASQELLAGLPALGTWNDVAIFFSSLVDAFWFGNPIESDFPLAFNGLCLTPLFSVLLLLSFVDGQWRRLWFWQVFVLACLLMTVWPAAFLFGVRYLSMGMSRSIPLGAAFIPAMTLAAYAADHVIRSGVRRRWLAASLAVLPAVVVVAGSLARPEWIQPRFIVVGVLFFVASWAFVWTRRAPLLLAIAIAGTFHFGYGLVLSRPPEQIHRTSRLVELMRRETGDRARYAWFYRRVIPPNQEALLGLRSIHTYNTLSSEAYRRWVMRVSERGVQEYFGGHFSYVFPGNEFPAEELSRAGVGLVISRHPLAPEAVRDAGRYGRLHAYAPRLPPVFEAQIRKYEPSADRGVAVAGGLGEANQLPVERTADEGDLLRFRLTASDQQTLLFVSQQHHPYWYAFSSDGQELPAVTVDEFYTGVLVPAGTTDIEIRFLPWARWSWVPQVFFLLGGALCGVRWLRTRRLAAAGANP